eukprot:755677-Hanusia_phi.AAC.11
MRIPRAWKEGQAKWRTMRGGAAQILRGRRVEGRGRGQQGKTRKGRRPVPYAGHEAGRGGAGAGHRADGGATQQGREQGGAGMQGRGARCVRGQGAASDHSRGVRTENHGIRWLQPVLLRGRGRVPAEDEASLPWTAAEQDELPTALPAARDAGVEVPGRQVLLEPAVGRRGRDGPTGAEPAGRSSAAPARVPSLRNEGGLRRVPGGAGGGAMEGDGAGGAGGEGEDGKDPELWGHHGRGCDLLATEEGWGRGGRRWKFLCSLSDIFSWIQCHVEKEGFLM